jgi:hypothetical protein
MLCRVIFRMKYLIFLLSACSTFFNSPKVTAITEADKVQTFAAKDVSQMMKAFSDALTKDGYQIKTQDIANGALVARVDNTNRLKKTESSFNSGFTEGSNYKVSEDIEVNVKISPASDGVVSNLAIKRVDKFSMGQELSEDILEPKLYQDIFSKVKLEL